MVKTTSSRSIVGKKIDSYYLFLLPVPTIGQILMVFGGGEGQRIYPLFEGYRGVLVLRVEGAGKEENRLGCPLYLRALPEKRGNYISQENQTCP